MYEEKIRCHSKAQEIKANK